MPRSDPSGSVIPVEDGDLHSCCKVMTSPATKWASDGDGCVGRCDLLASLISRRGVVDKNLGHETGFGFEKDRQGLWNV